MYALHDVALDPVAPPAMATLSDVKAHMGITTNTDDTKLTALIAVASDMIERYCGQILAARAVTELLIPEDPLETLALKHSPASALTSVTVDGEAQTLGDFLLMKAPGILRRVDGGPISGQNVRVDVVYTAGYATLPSSIANAALLLVQHLFNTKNRDSSIKSESSPDVGDIEYADLSRGANGIQLPADIALPLAGFVRWY